MASTLVTLLTLALITRISVTNAQSCTSGVRLNDGTSTPSASTQFGGGRVEVCDGGQWLSPVRSSFTMSAAHVACFQEYGGSAFATAVVDGTNFVATSNDLSDIVFNCLGTESNLFSCHQTSTLVDTSSTSAGPPIGTIRLVAGTSAQRGRVQLLASSSEWQNLYTESSDWTSLVADLVCRQLGFQSGLQGVPNDYDPTVDTGPFPYRIGNLNCPASAVQFFANCSFDATLGDSPAVVQCSSNVLADGTVRLLDSAGMPTTGETAGIVEMFIGSRWGPVCYNPAFGGNEEEALCNGLSYTGGGVASSRALSFTSNRPIWFDTVACTGTESSLFACDITTLGLPRTDRCDHASLLYVLCLPGDSTSLAGSMLAVHPGGITAILVVGLITLGFLFPFVAGLVVDISKGNRTCENCMNWLTSARRRSARFLSTTSWPSRRGNASAAYVTEVSEVSVTGVNRREREGQEEGQEEGQHEGEPENPELTAHGPPSYNEADKYMKEEEEEDLPPAYMADPDLPPYPLAAQEGDPAYPPTNLSDPAFPPPPSPSLT